MKKSERQVLISEALEKLYPDAHCELNYETPFQLLIAVVLSAQTTDKAVNKVTANLFKEYGTVASLAAAELEAIELILKPLGLYHNKASNIIKLARVLKEEYKGLVPDTHQQLCTLPGVGRKTANVVLAVAFEVAAFAVDTHVERVSKRLKIAKSKDSIIKVEEKLKKFFPKERWAKTHHQFIFFGRYLCKAQRPLCNECPLQACCSYFNQ